MPFTAQLEARAKFTSVALPEHGDDNEADRHDTEGGSARAPDGEENHWPYCTVSVSAHFAGLFGRAVSRRCSYESKEAFERSALHEPLRIAAFMDLTEQVRAQRAALASLTM
jgi:hypothetical protein